jgi:hypothetical protein
MSELDAALGHATLGRPVFPASSRKVPLIKDWGNAATTDPATITAWWTASPYALIGMPTGARTELAVLDIDMKNGKNGCRTLAKLGYVELPKTPTVLTPSGGFHLHLERPENGFRNTTGERGHGIGDGLDWRCDGGLVILPSPGSGYVWGGWDDTCPRLPVPADLMPREVEANPYSGRLATIGPTIEGLAGVTRCLCAASRGERNSLLFWAACRFAEAIAAGLIGEEDAWKILRRAARDTGLPDQEIAKTIDSAFSRGA